MSSRGTLLTSCLAITIALITAACQRSDGAEIPDLLPNLPVTPTELYVSPTDTAIVGRVYFTSGGDSYPLESVIVRLATVHWNEDRSSGVFALEGATAPSAVTSPDGTFVFEDLQPGDYVIVVGDVMGEHVIISGPNGKAKIYTTVGGQALNVGVLEVELDE